MRKAKVKLADGKERMIKHMSMTSFWDSDGRPISAEAYIRLLYGKLPEFYKSEEELRRIWSNPDTRKRLLNKLDEAGYGLEQLKVVQEIIGAEKSDIFDVLEYISYTIPPITRKERVEAAQERIQNEQSGEKRAFVDFALAKYIETGVSELDSTRLADLLRLKYKELDDAQRALGDVPAIRALFIGFQRHLYETNLSGAKGIIPTH